MSKGPFDSLNIYIHYGLRNLAFKNTGDDGPFLTPENFYKRYNIWCHNICVTIFDVTIFDVTIFDVTIFDVTIFDVTIFEITKEIPLKF